MSCYVFCLAGGLGVAVGEHWEPLERNAWQTEATRRCPWEVSTGISAEMRTNLHDVQTFSQSFSRKPWTSFRSFIFICYYIDHLVHQFIHVTWFSKISMNEKDYFKLEWKHIFRFTTWQSILIIVKYPILVFCWFGFTSPRITPRIKMTLQITLQSVQCNTNVLIVLALYWLCMAHAFAHAFGIFWVFWRGILPKKIFKCYVQSCSRTSWRQIQQPRAMWRSQPRESILWQKRFWAWAWNLGWSQLSSLKISQSPLIRAVNRLTVLTVACGPLFGHQIISN